MSDRRIIFVDVDGTLVDYRNNIPDSAALAVQEARANGHLVFLSTGRSKAEVYDELWEIGLDGLIGGNGSYVEYRGEVVLEQSMSTEQCGRVVAWLQDRGLEFYVECNAGLYGSKHFATAAEPTIRAYVRGKGESRHGGVDVDDLTISNVFPHMIFGEELVRSDANKISYILSSPEDHAAATRAFPDLASGTWGGRGSAALFGDLGVADVSKALAIESLLGHVGAQVSETLGFGDAAVDIPMLKFCAVGVAMGNGSDEIKQIADHITDDVESDGLANAFRHYGLI